MSQAACTRHKWRVPITSGVVPLAGGVALVTGAVVPLAGDVALVTSNVIPATDGVVPIAGDVALVTGAVVPLAGGVAPRFPGSSLYFTPTKAARVLRAEND